MVRYVSLEEQVDADFSRARRRAFLRRISARLRKRPIPDRLLCFEEVRRKLGVAGGVRRGRRTVRLADIVGSVSRCSEFDGVFLPLREGARTKWERIDRAFHHGEELPPVNLYKIGDRYFVLDGNHRVSVYRYQGVEFTDAEVTEFRASSPGDRRAKAPDPIPGFWRRRVSIERGARPSPSRRSGRPRAALAQRGGDVHATDDGPHHADRASEHRR